MPRPRPRFVAPLLAPALIAIACGNPAATATAGEDASPTPRSTRLAAPPVGELPETRPAPFEVEFRERDGERSTLLRVTDGGLRYTLGHDPHDVSVTVALSPAQTDGLYATLVAQALHEIDTVADREAEVDGTSIRMLAGAVRASASRMGHFVPAPQFAARYDACVQALRGLAPPALAEVDGSALVIEFDPSMAQRRASVALDLGHDLVGLIPGPAPTLVIRGRNNVMVRLRHGPPAREVELDVDLATHHRVLVRVDPELNEPTLVPQAT